MDVHAGTNILQQFETTALYTDATIFGHSGVYIMSYIILHMYYEILMDEATETPLSRRRR